MKHFTLSLYVELDLWGAKNVSKIVFLLLNNSFGMLILCKPRKNFVRFRTALTDSKAIHLGSFDTRFQQTGALIFNCRARPYALLQGYFKLRLLLYSEKKSEQ